jgi:probable HAF family extracellular repeat protein
VATVFALLPDHFFLIERRSSIMKFIRCLNELLVLSACLAFLQGCATYAYEVTAVAGAGSAAFGINRYGHTVGSVDAGGGHEHAFLNDGSGAKDIGTLGGANSRAWGLNNAGQVVGEAENAGGVKRAFVYDGGSMNDLGTLGGPASSARAINDDGTIVGWATLADGSERAFSYSSGAMANLGTFPSRIQSYSRGNAINRRGVIAGRSSIGTFSPPEPPVHAFVRRTSGKMMDLGTFGGAYSEAFGINDKDEVVGTGATKGLDANDAFLYSGGVKHDIGTLPPNTYAEAYDINNRSQVVGTSAGSYVMPDRGFLYEDNQIIALNELVDPGSGWTITAARAINDRRQIAGTGCKAGVCYAVRLDPTK